MECERRLRPHCTSDETIGSVSVKCKYLYQMSPCRLRTAGIPPRTPPSPPQGDGWGRTGMVGMIINFV
eukprot:3531493-Prymnesium_polylepis.2